MDRITLSDLRGMVDRINSTLAVSQDFPYTYCLSQAYGGVSLHVICDGGRRDVFHCGYTTRRDLYNRMESFIRGMDSVRK